MIINNIIRKYNKKNISKIIVSKRNLYRGVGNI